MTSRALVTPRLYCRMSVVSEDFSEENLKKAGITRRFVNADKIQCLEEITGEIRYDKL